MNLYVQRNVNVNKSVRIYITNTKKLVEIFINTRSGETLWRCYYIIFLTRHTVKETSWQHSDPYRRRKVPKSKHESKHNIINTLFSISHRFRIHQSEFLQSISLLGIMYLWKSHCRILFPDLIRYFDFENTYFQLIKAFQFSHIVITFRWHATELDSIIEIF